MRGKEAGWGAGRAGGVGGGRKGVGVGERVRVSVVLREGCGDDGNLGATGCDVGSGDVVVVRIPGV